ncbi:MAG: DegT/DnrJ/EryC1/StrS family aminotransferase [Candidatus Omnitrophota bacterium]
MIRRRSPRFYKGQFKDILSLLKSGRVSEGEYINLFEIRFAQYIGTKFALATSSGREALMLLLKAWGIKAGDEVILPAYTLLDLISLIREEGIIPKLVDIERGSLNLDPDLLEGQITSKTRAIIATHIFGVPCSLDRVLSIAKKHDIKVIEDACHALGAEYKGKKIGSLADAAFFSLEVTKQINTFGGGVVTTNDDEIAEKIKEQLNRRSFCPFKLLNKIFFNYLEDLLIKSPAYPVLVSLFRHKSSAKIIKKLYFLAHSSMRIQKTRLHNLQALMGLKQMDLLDKENEKRNSAASLLYGNLNKRLLLQEDLPGAKRVFYFFVARLKDTGNTDLEDFRKRLLIYGIDCGIKNEITDNCAVNQAEENNYPVTREIFSSALQLPIYDELSEKEIKRIALCLNRALL